MAKKVTIKKTSAATGSTGTQTSAPATGIPLEKTSMKGTCLCKLFAEIRLVLPARIEAVAFEMYCRQCRTTFMMRPEVH